MKRVMMDWIYNVLLIFAVIGAAVAVTGMAVYFYITQEIQRMFDHTHKMWNKKEDQDDEVN